MLQEHITLSSRKTVTSETTGLLLTALATTSYYAEIVIGRPGLKNLRTTLNLGDAVLFETPEGILEIRAMANTTRDVDLLLTRISPRPGIAAGLVDQDPENIPFLAEERDRIARSIEEIKSSMSDRSDVTAEQLGYLSAKLDEMRDASERLGKKDWINYALGTLTGIVITAAFDRAAATALLHAADLALSWVFGGGIKLLP
jgi:hypothetical protein